MGSDAHRADAETVRAPQFLDRSDARNQKRRQHRMFDDISRCLDPLPIGVGPKPVIKGCPVEAVAMRDFDGIDPGCVERLCNGSHAVGAIHVKDGMHPVAERYILDVKRLAGWIEGHAAILPRSEEHTSELQSLMRISYAVFCLKKK